MRKKEDISSYTAKELAAMRQRGEGRTDWVRVDSKTEAELAADTAGDPAWEGVPGDWVKWASAASGALVRPRENKRQVTMRFDADVLDYFRRQGRGWQGRMNAVLRNFIERRH
jgi:uncharacterized protein (DUF4415 family)